MQQRRTSPMVRRMSPMENGTPVTKKEVRSHLRKSKQKSKDPEFVDNYIYEIEHALVLNGIVNWQGCCINESWEHYKESVGYYERHPEQAEESRAFTKEVMKWWRRQKEEAVER